MEVAMEPQHTAGFFNHFPDHAVERRLSTVPEEGVYARQRESSRQTSSPDTDDNPAKRQRTGGYECAPCNMNFTEKRALARHRKTDHHRRQIGLPPDRRHACVVCGKHFTRGHDLKRHQNEQHTDIPAHAAGLSSGVSEDSTEHTTSEEPPYRASSAESTAYGPATTDASASLHMTPSPQATYSGSTNTYAGFVPDGVEPRMDHHNITHPLHRANSLPNGPIAASSRQVPALNNIPDLMETDHTDSSTWSPDSYRTPPSRGSDTAKSPGDASGILPLSSASSQLRLADIERQTPMYAREVDIDSWQPLMCVVCGIPYEDDPEELVGHLRRHLDTSRGSHQCTECLIGFVHEEDLERHLQCAADGHCGFSFPHTNPCTGHHPPQSGSNLAGLSDYDRVRLSDRLNHWEQAQLRAYIAEIDGLLTLRRTPRAARWSDVIGGSSRRNSQSSFAISVKTFASAPCDGTDGKMDIGGLQRRMQHMSLGNAKTRMSRMMRPSSSHSQDSANKALRKALKHGQLQKVAQQLDAGGDPSIVQEEAPFVTAALWGHGYVAERMAAHRLDEDIMGKCMKCDLKSSSLEDPTHKVRALLRHGAETNRQGGLCDYPLVTAAWLGRPNVVKMLLDHDAKVDLHASKYGTALCAAASQAGSPGHAQVIDLLLEYGADPTIRMLNGTALQLAKNRLDAWTSQSDESLRPKRERGDEVSNCQKAVLALETAESAPTQIIARPAAAKKRLRTVASEPALDLYACWKV